MWLAASLSRPVRLQLQEPNGKSQTNSRRQAPDDKMFT
jgi:hypothetical protein